MASSRLPLAWVAVFDDATVIRRPPHEPPHAAARVPAAAVVPAPWTPSLARDDFAAAIARVAAFIAAGDTYQVNYTFALEREGAGPIESGDLDAWVDALCIGARGRLRRAARHRRLRRPERVAGAVRRAARRSARGAADEGHQPARTLARRGSRAA